MPAIERRNPRFLYSATISHPSCIPSNGLSRSDRPTPRPNLYFRRPSGRSEKKSVFLQKFYLYLRSWPLSPHTPITNILEHPPMRLSVHFASSHTLPAPLQPPLKLAKSASSIQNTQMKKFPRILPGVGNSLISSPSTFGGSIEPGL